AGPGGVVPAGLEVVEECGDQLGVQVSPVQGVGWLAGSLLGEGEQQLERIAVRGDGAGAGAALADQPLGEESLQGGGDRGHRCAASCDCSSWRAASARSSGAADRYQ